MTDWAAWSRTAVEQLKEKNASWRERFGIANDAAYRWTLDPPKMEFNREAGPVTARLCMVGSSSESMGTFLWAWANDTIPSAARNGLEDVQSFGAENDLRLLIDAEYPGARPEGLEALAIAARIMEADGAWIETTGDLVLFFALFDFEETGAG